MARTPAEVADLLEQAHEGLMIMAKAVSSDHPDAGVRFYTKDGVPFTLPELAEDLRAASAE